MKKSASQIAIVKNETPAPLPPPSQRDYADFDVFLRRLCALDRRLSNVVKLAETISEALDSDKPTEATLNNLYAQQKAVAQLNVGILQEIAWVAAEREFYNAEGLFDSVDGVWRLKRRVISEQVAALIGSFPNCGPHNPQTYAGMLTNEIAAADPDAITLEATCRIVRRTKNFAPTIAEVLETLKEQSSAVSDMAEADELKNWKHWNNDIAENLAELRAKVGLPPE